MRSEQEIRDMVKTTERQMKYAQTAIANPTSPFDSQRLVIDSVWINALKWVLEEDLDADTKREM